MFVKNKEDNSTSFLLQKSPQVKSYKAVYLMQKFRVNWMELFFEGSK